MDQSYQPEMWGMLMFGVFCLGIGIGGLLGVWVSWPYAEAEGRRKAMAESDAFYADYFKLVGEP